MIVVGAIWHQGPSPTLELQTRWVHAAPWYVQGYPGLFKDRVEERQEA